MWESALSISTFTPPASVATGFYAAAWCHQSSENVVFWTSAGIGQLDIIRAAGAIIGQSSEPLRYRIAVDFAKAERPTTAASTLRLRTCRALGCRVMFFVCVRCDRGQRYCCDDCRKAARRRQTRAANKRYQRGEAGRLAHRARQKTYRAHRSRRSVTYQGTTSATAPRLGRPICPPTCAICGHQTVWVDPFTQLHFRIRRSPPAHRRR